MERSKAKINRRLSLEAYREGVLGGSRVILGQAITLVESALESDAELASQLVQSLLPFTGNSLRIGVTGVPGVGKSSFIETFGGLVLEQGKRLAVLAVDPSSQVTKGSILGDKTRMGKLASDKRAFIRPSPAGSQLGGISSKTRETMLICEAAGFDVILVETVGVGQSETAVRGMVDFFLLLMLAGAGDELQGIKKGIVEMADAIVIHKADGENQIPAQLAQKTYQNALHLLNPTENNWVIPVLTGSSMTGKGIAEIWDTILNFQKQTKLNGIWDQNRANQRVNWLDEQVDFLLRQRFRSDPSVQKLLENQREKVRKGEISPMSLARELIQLFLESLGNNN
jgi:LAO/AO transport system kinase